MTVLVTGATGFVGRRLCARLKEDGRFAVRAAVRREAMFPAGVEPMVVGALGMDAAWARALAGASVVVHLAARAHVMRDTASDPLAEFRRVNVEGTARLARQAAVAGVKRLVFLSSAKVNGETGTYTEADPPRPEGPYAVSKHEAEEALREVARETGLEAVIVRPPLVYGPGVQANFRALLRAVARGLPLPFGAVRNRRSLVALDNLVDFVITCMLHPAAAGETFLVSDGDDLSTAELVRRIARAFHRSAWLLPVPEPLLYAAAALTGRRAAAQKVLGSLQVDISKARRVLGWSPPCGVEDELRRIARSA